MTRRALILVGSPKPMERSASAQLARLVTSRLEVGRWIVDWIHLAEALADDEATCGLLSAVDSSDVLLLTAPLYVDSLPAPVIRALERISAHRAASDGPPDTSFCTILNCGFVEPLQNGTAQRICRRFCSEAGFKWRGALSVGSAGQVTGRVKRLLRAAGDALALGDRIPVAVERDLQRPIIPRWAYVVGGNAMWRRVAQRRFGVSRARLRARPYDVDPERADQS